MLGPAGEGPRCLPKVSAWRHGASSEGHAAVSASCLSVCDGSIERWPVTMSKPPRGRPPRIQATPMSRGCWVRGLQTCSPPLSMERAPFSGPASPAFPPRRDARRGPSTISPSDSAPLLLCSPRPSWPSREGTPALVPWPQGCSVRGLSPVRDCSHLVTGSPSLPDKYRHAREMMLLLPAHRDRPSSAMYPAAILENGQVARAAHQLSPTASLLA